MARRTVRHDAAAAAALPLPVRDRHHDYPEERFWGQVRAAIEDYHERFPELEDRFELFDLLEPTFPKLILNRNRIVDVGYGDLLERPHAIEHGTVPNPLSEVESER
ncbi:ferric iron reductase [Natrinema amylolyticum]|uniref:ferric iron reductase n=1 Tax=Natrinema amylolyticum TaxID=2878679 RepID=UPI00299CE61F|nr:IucA/IucC family C-terminal-domain containing protein [Natrinema amylolyticum]